MYQVEISVFKEFKKTRTGTYPRYRITREYYKDGSKARKRFDRLVELHGPEWRITLGDISSGFFNMIEVDNSFDHAVWLFTEHEYKTKRFNIEAIKKAAMATA